jgi:hypothetical protein
MGLLGFSVFEWVPWGIQQTPDLAGGSVYSCTVLQFNESSTPPRLPNVVLSKAVRMIGKACSPAIEGS